MKFKILGSLVIGAMLLAGCGQGGGQQDDGGSEQDAPSQPQQQPPAGQQQMPGQMQQTQDLEVSDSEIEKFVKAAQEVQTINMQMQKDMGKAIQDEGMKTQRFNEIHKSQQSPQGGQTNASDQEMQKYRNILETLKKKQSGIQQDMRKAIKSAGLSLQRYQQIARSAQKDSALMKRLQEAMKGSMSAQ